MAGFLTSFFRTAWPIASTGLELIPISKGRSRWPVPLVLLCAIWVGGCLPGDGPDRVTFSGRSYSGIGLAGLTVLESQVAPVGSAVTVNTSEISDHTVYKLESVAESDAVLLRRDNGDWALFVSRRFDEIPSLCAYYDPKPSDCT